MALVVTPEMIAVFAIILGALVLFALELVRYDIVAIGVMSILIILGLVTPEEGISGFANRATITVLAMFILSAGITRTGLVNRMAGLIQTHVGNSTTSQLLAIIAVVGPLSAFINNTAAVAILLPMVVDMAERTNRSPSKFLIPLSFASMLAGVLTLIGTSTNILAGSLATGLNVGELSMFSFTHVGLVVFVPGVLYLLFVAPRLLPDRRPGHSQEEHEEEIVEKYRLKDYLSEVRIDPGSAMIGQLADECDLQTDYDIDVIRLFRSGEIFDQPLSGVRLHAGDILLVNAKRQDILDLPSREGITFVGQPPEGELGAGNVGLVEVIVSPNSVLEGRTLREATFRERFGLNVLAVNKHEKVVRQRVNDTEINFGDSLLVQGPQPAIDALKRDPSFIVAEEIQRQDFRNDKQPIALGIMAGVVVFAALGTFPILVTALVGAILMVLTGCLDVGELYDSVRWDVIFLLAGVIPLGIAMQNTGAAQYLGDLVASTSAYLPAIGVLAVFYVATVALTSIVSNNASVVVMIPVAVAAARDLGLNPMVFLLAVMFAASTSFMTPIGYQTNTFVYGPGGYTFGDFTKVGAPLNLILGFVTIAALVWFFPL